MSPTQKGRTGKYYRTRHMSQSYYSFSSYLKKKFKCRVQRISLNAGLNCPNRDGTFGFEGCYFCNEKGFVNFDNSEIALDEQIQTSLSFFKKRFKAEKFIAYFQNASNTYAPVEKLRAIYDVIKKYPEFVGLFISTRPDCIDEEKLDMISAYNDKYDVWIEYGLQTIHDKTLEFLNRRHTFRQFQEAVELTARRNIKTAAHVILGLPRETRQDMLQTAKALTELGLSGVKLHMFHVLKETEIARMYEQGKISLLSEEEYVEIVCDFLERISPECVIMRLVSNSKDDVLISPKWINRKQEVQRKIEEEFKKRKTRQGFYK
ncbi:MAG: TIGR01212 family radical SAM protein [Candidatus Omnitrophica bacterium]|nr:TIGR01212 family radical SAM protein [Candidatus Omnitrophota bacterium]